MIQRYVKTGRFRLLTQSEGFTLIEIMVVVVILGILASVVVVNVTPSISEGANAKIKHDLQSIESALELYKIDNFSYPTTEQGLDALVNKPDISPEPTNWKRYIKRLPKDPWKRTYIYVSPGQHGEVDIYTYGADGQSGGELDNKDFGNWNL
ncbi:MAG: type II secretion system protein GspG [Gammaproteobacteria bacterium SG8_11]|nr:MAG: type II secretion system protein GspG [Gammaproteobacteria bacterium SG8_11]